jgi:hypothetical protein
VKQPRRNRQQGSKESEETAAIPDATVPISATGVTTSGGSDLIPSHLGIEDSGLARPGTESHDLFGRLNHAQVVGFEEQPGFPFSLNEDGAFGMGLGDTYRDDSPSTIDRSISKTTLPEIDGFVSLPEVSLLNNTSHTNSNKINDIDWESYSYLDQRELQMQSFSPTGLSPAIINSVPSFRIPPTMTMETEHSPSSDAVLSGHFAKNRTQSPLQEALATVIIDSFLAYPRMMTRRETFPPFVHAHSPAGDTEDHESKLPEHLINCMGIAQLFTVCNDDTRVFLWSAIREEMRGFNNRKNLFNKYDALSALQATLLYLIMRAGCDAPQQSREDYEMLLTYQVCAKKLKLKHIETTIRETC